MKRADGRKPSELRPMEAKVGIIKNALGSAMFKIGKTTAIAAVYGPKAIFPKFLQEPSRGRLRCNYNMVAFSGSGERVRPGPSRRSKEISLVTEKALAPAIDLLEFPKAAVDVFIELIETDAGTRCAGITAAAMALAHAGFKMKDLVTAVSCGTVDREVIVDLSYDEEASDGAVDIPIAIMPRTGEITLLQLDGKIKEEDFKKAIKLAKEAVGKIYEVQKEALRKSLGEENDNK